MLFMAGILFTCTGCATEDLQVYEQNTELRSATGFIRNNFDLSLFYAALEKTGLLEELDGRSEMTVFAPNNAAFNAAGIRSASDFDKLHQDSLRFMLRYHILEAPLLYADLPERSVDSEYKNLAGKTLFVAKTTAFGNSNTIYVNGVGATYRDIQLSNGLLHIIGSVLKYREGTVQEWLETNKNYTCLVAGLKKFGLWEQLSEEGPWLVAAPDNAAFAAQGLDVEAIENLNTSDYGTRLFAAYVFKPRIFLADLNVMVYGEGAGVTYPTFSIIVPGDPLFTSNITWNKDRRKYQFTLTSGSSQVPDAEKNKFLYFPADYAVNNLTDNGVIHCITELITTTLDTPVYN